MSSGRPAAGLKGGWISLRYSFCSERKYEGHQKDKETLKDRIISKDDSVIIKADFSIKEKLTFQSMVLKK